MSRLTAEQIAAKSAKARAAWGVTPAEVKAVFGTLTERPTYQLGKPLVLELPYPPSVNTYWRHLPNGRTLLSAKAREYRKIVIALTGVKKPLLARLSMVIELYPPDKRLRDLDNCVKAVWDSLQHAGVYRDDEQIDEFTVRRCERVKGGHCVVTIKTLDA